MQNLEGLYEDIKKYNELFKAKTYSDAVEEFYKKNYSIFMPQKRKKRKRV